MRMKTPLLPSKTAIKKKFKATYRPDDVGWARVVHGCYVTTETLFGDIEGVDLSFAARKKRTKKKPKPERPPYEVLNEFPVDEILPFLEDAEGTMEFEDRNGNFHEVFTTSLRYKTFSINRECVFCGIEGTVMRLERTWQNTARPHFNLYAVTPAGEYVLMTKDHILPKSKGGKDHISNMQTACGPCNFAKGNKTDEGGSVPNVE